MKWICKYCVSPCLVSMMGSNSPPIGCVQGRETTRPRWDPVDEQSTKPVLGRCACTYLPVNPPHNANTGGMVQDTRTDTPETPGKDPNSDWSVGGAVTKKDRLIVLQTCLKTAGEVYIAIWGKPDTAPAVITEWAIFMARGIIAEANQE